MAVDFVSASAAVSAGNATAWDLAVDDSGNTCLVGSFRGTADFDPGPGVLELSSASPTTSSLFAAKYDSAGNLLWATRVGGNGGNYGPEIAAGSDGSVYVVASFTGSAEFGATTLTSLGADDAFVTKLDAHGNFAWARRFGSVNADYGTDIAVDGVGNVYVMAETCNFSSSSPDAFIGKMDAAGNVLWTKEIGASSSATTKGKNPTSSGFARGLEIALDGSGNPYAMGVFRGTVDFDPSSVGNSTLKNPSVATSAFVLKLNTSGQFIWARSFDANPYSSCWPYDIAVDAFGNVYTTGTLYGTVDFDPGAAKYQLSGGTDVNGTIISATFASALNSSGNFLWAKSTQSVGGTGYNAKPNALAHDGAGGIYIAGEFSGTADFNPTAGVYGMTAAGGTDAFIWKLDTSGNFDWAGQMGGTSTDRARGIGVDAVGNIYVAGSFSGTADFDPGSGSYNLTTSAGGGDVFVAKFSQPLPLAAAKTQASSLPLTTSSSRRLSSNAVDNALAEESSNMGSASWRYALDDALLLALAST
ncbi:MAG: SBBP repeat-containing protein [Pirellulales bacterium]|nr:SBBP repeat-containing protein [Pirellulales bacterium]